MTASPSSPQRIDTGGGAYVAGDVTADNFAGRDIYVGYSYQQVQALISEIRRPNQPSAWDGREPYIGLDAFQESDAKLFFGREKLVEQLVQQVRQSRFICVTGPSGSGKSSLVRAGLLHALRHGALPGSDKWLCETLTPRSNPIEQLASAMSALALRTGMSASAGDVIRATSSSDPQALGKLADVLAREGLNQRVVLLVDQFEEIFTQTKDENERRSFLAQVTTAPGIEAGRVTVVIAMRSDFVSRSASYPSLRSSLSGQFQLVGAMEPEELARAITLPALEVGAEIEPRLVSKVIADTQGEPGSLPLMQFALRDLFDAQKRVQGQPVKLTLSDYLKRGGMQQALERHADAAFKRLNELGQLDIARHVFSQLIEIGHGTVDTRRTATFAELVPVGKDPDFVATVVNVLSEARLITADTQKAPNGEDIQTATLAHETLIEAWPWLKRLVSENRSAIALQNDIGDDAVVWNKHGRDASYLYVGARLQTVQEQLAADKISLNALAQAFVDEGAKEQRAREAEKQARQREKEEALRREAEQARLVASQQQQIAAEQGRRADAEAQGRRRVQRALVGLFAVFVAALIAGTLAYVQYRNSKARQLAAQAAALAVSEPDTGLLLAVEAMNTQLGNLSETDNALRFTTQCCSSQLVSFFRGHEDRVWATAFNHDTAKPMMASASDDGTVVLWDVLTRQQIRKLEPPQHGVNLHAVAFTPDDKVVAAAGSGDAGVVLWDVGTGNVITSLMGHGGSVLNLALSDDGARLVSGGADGRKVVWDITDIGAPKMITSHLQLAVSTSGSPWVWSVAISPDKRTVASAGRDGYLQVWNIEPGRGIISSTAIITSIGKDRLANTVSVAFDPSGRWVATGHTNGNLRLWDLEPWLERHELPKPVLAQKIHDNTIWGLAFSQDGRLATGAETGRLHFWRLDVSNPAKPALRGLSSYLDGHARGIFRLSWDASWGRMAAGSLDGLVSLWQTNSGDALLGHRSPILDIQPDETGKRLWSVSADGQLLAWDVPKRAISTTFTLASTQSYTFTFAAFSPDGARLVTDGLSRTVTLWRTSDGLPVRELGAHAAEITSIVFSSTGRDVATGGRDGHIMVWAVDGGPGRMISAFDKGRVSSLAFSQDGTLLAAGGCGSLIVTGGTSCGRGEIRLFRMSDLSEVGDPLPAASGYVTSLAFSPDGRCMAVGSDDNKIDMRDLGQCAFHGRLPTLHTDTVNVLQFANSGRMFASGSEDADVRLWSADRGLPIGRQFGEHNSIVSALAFNADDTLLFTAGRDYSASNERTIVVHDLTQDGMLERACRMANRNLTQVEWQQYIGDGILEPYRKTCPSLP